MTQMGHQRHFERKSRTSAYPHRCVAAPLGDQPAHARRRAPHGGISPSCRSCCAGRGCALAAENAECLSDIREELLYHVVELGDECDRLGLNSRIARVVKFVQLAEVRQIFQHERVAF